MIVYSRYNLSSKEAELSFARKLEDSSRANESLLSIGLDPDPGLMPRVGVFEFNQAIIDATSDLVCAYKLNLAFYEAIGLDGLRVLEKTIEHIPGAIPVIGDAKRGDVGSTARMYAKAIFETFGFDAATVNPYLGYDSIEPFMEYEDRGVFILCRTSNSGARDFQSLACSDGGESLPLFELVALKAREWNRYGNVGLVAGATYPEELGRVRELCPEMTLLIPGIGAQGGDLTVAVQRGVDAQGGGAIFSSSRNIIYASGGMDFASAARSAAQGLRHEIDSLRGRMDACENPGG
jgi:orotidine-5'-phosphate decarboxylase